MEYLEPKPLYESPDFYKNPTGVGSFSNMGNAVRKGRSELILTEEYADLDSISMVTTLSGYITYLLVFKKLRYEYSGNILGTNPQGLPYGLTGVLIKGYITFTDNTQACFNSSIGITLDSPSFDNLGVANTLVKGRTISMELTIKTSLTVSDARIRISQT